MATVSKPARTTPPVRLSFANQLWVPKAGDNGVWYSVALMFDKNSSADKAFLKDLRADYEAVLAEQWPDESKRPRIPFIGGPIKDGDVALNKSGIPLKEKYPDYAGHWIMSVGTSDQPPIVGREMVADGTGQMALRRITDSNEVYSGCLAKVNVNAYARTRQDNPGGSFGLNGVQKWEEGERIGGGRAAVGDMFEGEESATGADNPANYGASDDPFAGTAASSATATAEADPFA